MNEGIGRAQGDIVGILAADDRHASDLVLERVREAILDSRVDASYGDLVYVKPVAKRDGSRVSATAAPQLVPTLWLKPLRKISQWWVGKAEIDTA